MGWAEPAGASGRRRPGPGPVFEDTWAASWLMGSEIRDKSQIPSRNMGPTQGSGTLPPVS